MALGGGNFTLQNKVLPGSYINVVSASGSGTAAAKRGNAAIGMELEWGEDNKIITLTSGDFQKNSRKILGYDYTHEKLKGLRDLFKNAHTVYLYKLTSGGTKASNEFAEALYCGARGNDLRIVVAANVDTEGSYDVSTYLDARLVDTQTVTKNSELEPNDYVTFKKDGVLEATAGINLTGGTNGTVDGGSHQDFLDRIERFTNTNAIGTTSTEKEVKSLYAAFAKRMRDEVGVKLQAVLYKYPADYEGVVNVKNKADESTAESSMVYWTLGATAGCAINADNTNKTYDGEFKPDVEYTQTELEKAIINGEFVFHQVGNEVKVLDDINSLTTLTEEKGEIFKSNRTIRTVDQIATDIAALFNTMYLGSGNNDKDGRISLWKDIVKHHEELQKIRAIENFVGTDVVVEQGESRDSVAVTDSITVTSTMKKLYMTVVVR